MAVSKRTRYEVLRRDDHTCRYCGGRAPDVKLTLDHVLPVALGGGDDPANLVTACRDCNAGKTSTTPDAALVAQVSDDASRWALARKAAADKLARDKRAARRRHQQFLKTWRYWDDECAYLPDDFDISIDGWVAAGLSMAVIEEALEISLGTRTVSARYVFRYMAGVLKNKLRELDAATAAQIKASTPEPEPAPIPYERTGIDWLIERLDLLTTERKSPRIGRRNVLDNLPAGAR